MSDDQAKSAEELAAQVYRVLRDVDDPQLPWARDNLRRLVALAQGREQAEKERDEAVKKMEFQERRAFVLASGAARARQLDSRSPTSRDKKAGPLSGALLVHEGGRGYIEAI